MGHVDAKIDLAAVRKKMSKSRTYMSRHDDSLKVQRFCKDSEVFNWVCRLYRFNHYQWHGNIDRIDDGTFPQFFDILTDTVNYRIMIDDLKTYLPDSEAEYLIRTAKVLRQRYR